MFIGIFRLTPMQLLDKLFTYQQYQQNLILLLLFLKKIITYLFFFPPEKNKHDFFLNFCVLPLIQKNINL